MQWLCSYPSNLHFATALRWKETLVQSASMQDWLSRLATAVKSQLARAVSPVPTARLGGVAPLLQQYRLHHIGNALQLKAVYTNTIRLTTKVIGHGAGAEIYGGKRVTYCGCGNCPQDWSLGVWWAPITAPLRCTGASLCCTLLHDTPVSSRCSLPALCCP